jgi:hypothetical protein
MKGSPPAPQLSGEISSVVNFFSGAENRYLESWDRFGRAFQQIGAAGNLSSVRLRNPNSSNTIVVIEKIDVGFAVLDNLLGFIGPSIVDLAATVGGQRFDPRGRPGSTAILSTGASPGDIAAGVTILFHAVPANQFFSLIQNENQEITLLPGDLLELRNSTVNITFQGCLWWRERSLEDSERQ